jgi:hypothetical protein
VVGVIDDRNLSPAKKWTQANPMTKALLVPMVAITNEKLDRQRGFIRRQTDHLEVRMIPGREHPARLTFPTRFKGRVIARQTQQRMSQFHGKTPFANAGRPHEQIRAGQPPRLERPAKLLHHIVMPNNAVPHA